MGTVYESVILLCSEKGIKPGKMCADTGISRGLITDLKMGRKQTITGATAKKIADYFGVSVDRVLGGESVAENEKSPAPVGAEQIPGYANLSDTNKAIVDTMIAQLLAAQSAQE